MASTAEYLSNSSSRSAARREAGDHQGHIEPLGHRAYVTLLVEASWARGRLVREYTVLLDPPVFMPSQPSARAGYDAAVRHDRGRSHRAPVATAAA